MKYLALILLCVGCSKPANRTHCRGSAITVLNDSPVIGSNNIAIREFHFEGRDYVIVNSIYWGQVIDVTKPKQLEGEQ